jgi:hypothetical protein
MRKEYKFKVHENIVPKKVFRLKNHEIYYQFMIFHKEQLYDLCRSFSVVWLVSTLRLQCA